MGYRLRNSKILTYRNNTENYSMNDKRNAKMIKTIKTTKDS